MDLKLLYLNWVILFGLLNGTLVCWPHPGRTDKNGGHWNRKTGKYHHHGTSLLPDASTNINENAHKNNDVYDNNTKDTVILKEFWDGFKKGFNALDRKHFNYYEPIEPVNRSEIKNNKNEPTLNYTYTKAIPGLSLEAIVKYFQAKQFVISKPTTFDGANYHTQLKKHFLQRDYTIDIYSIFLNDICKMELMILNKFRIEDVDQYASKFFDDITQLEYKDSDTIKTTTWLRNNIGKNAKIQVGPVVYTLYAKNEGRILTMESLSRKVEKSKESITETRTIDSNSLQEPFFPNKEDLLNQFLDEYKAYLKSKHHFDEKRNFASRSSCSHNF